MSSENISLNHMPFEVILRILSSLTPGMLFSIRKTSKTFHYVFELLDSVDETNIEKNYSDILSTIPAEVNHFWHQKLITHFAHYKLLIKTEYSKTCWLLEYIKYAMNDYKKLPKNVRLLISYVKEGDAESLQALFEHDPDDHSKKSFFQFNGFQKTTLNDINFKDNTDYSVLNYIINSPLKQASPENWQIMADSFFKFFRNSCLYANNHSPNLIKRAVQFNQPRKIFDELIEKKLITKRELEETIDNGGNCPIHYAVQLGHCAAMEALIELSCSVNILNNDNASPLYIACDKGNYFAVKYLLEHGAEDSLNIHNKCFTYTPYLIAVAKGYADIVQYLHTYLKNDKSCNVNAIINCDETVLHSAAMSRNINVVNYIIEHMGVADINKTNIKKSTPLFLAASNGSIDIVITLAKIGADVNHCNGEMTPLCAASKNNHIRIVEFLLNQNAPINFISPTGMTALFCTAKEGHLETLKFLVSKGADINYPVKKSSFKPLVGAAKNDHEYVVKYLIQSGADDNQIKKAIKAAIKNIKVKSLNVLMDEKAELMLDVDIDFIEDELGGLNTSVLSILPLSTIAEPYEHIEFHPASHANSSITHCKINAYILLAIKHELSFISEDEMEEHSLGLLGLLTKIKAERHMSFEDIVKSSNLKLDSAPKNLSNFIYYLISVSKEYTAKPEVQLSSLYEKNCIFNEEKMYCSSAASNTSSAYEPRGKMF